MVIVVVVIECTRKTAWALLFVQADAVVSQVHTMMLKAGVVGVHASCPLLPHIHAFVILSLLATL